MKIYSLEDSGSLGGTVIILTLVKGMALQLLNICAEIYLHMYSKIQVNSNKA